MTDLEVHIQSSAMVDTHEHLNTEKDMLSGPDILNSLFDHYTHSDLVAAGASQEAIAQLTDQNNPDIRGRFAGIQDAWQACQFTGYGEGVRWVAREMFGIDEIDANSIERAAPQALAMHKPGERLRILRDVARLDHVQIDNFNTVPELDPDEPAFFRYDLSWLSYARGTVTKDDYAQIFEHAAVRVVDVPTLKRGITGLFAAQAKRVIAVKTQHAYDRTLAWRARSDHEAEVVLQKSMLGANLIEADRLCLGDWCLGQAARHAGEHNLPVKIHTGYHAGNREMPMDWLHASHLSPLIAAYPKTRFVLMHTAYPFGGEVLALAKHYPNVYADMCWAWSIDPHSSAQFLRQYLHTAPANKLFVFGGDSFWPHAAAAYAWQARRGLTTALKAEIADGALSERQAIALATRWMSDNAHACFGTTRASAAAAP